ncbi:MAG: HAD-IA family hydrolase, partial [Candidatus Symbiothrix sp.]|nr:HAD-IA family hydrolase [Candidatus Symbiothrix sp.]
MIKAILFDMDGVLYDSMPSHVQAWYDVATSWNIEASTDEFYLYEGRTGQSTVNLLFNRQFGRDANPEEMQRIYEQKARRFIELEQPESRPMPGALEVLQKIKDLGLQRIIVTGSGQHDLFAKLDKHFFGFFNHEQMITAYDVKFGKPHPEPYLMGLKKANVCPNEAIVVENAPLGVESAHA